MSHLSRLLGSGGCVALCLALASCQKATTQEQKKTPPEVTVAVPVVRPVTPYEEFTGTTAAIDTVDVRARVSGYLTDICFTPGEEVAEWKEVKTEKGVKQKRTVLFKIDARPYVAALEKAEADVAAYEARVGRLTTEAERAERLLKSKTISQEDYDKSQSDLKEAMAGVLAAKAVRDRADLDVQYTEVTAAMAGKISRNLISKGNMVTADSTLLTTIVAVEKMYAYFDVDERRLLRLQALGREQDAAQAKKGNQKPDAKPETESEGEDDLAVFLAIGDSKDYLHKGFLNFAEPRVNPETGTLQVRAEFKNPKIGKQTRALTPGMFVRLRVPIDEPKPAILVTDEAIASDQGQKYVWVVNDKNVASRRLVQLGPLEGQLRVIVQGLQKDERVVVNGLQKVRDGAAVAPQTGKMPGDEPKTDKTAAPQS